MIGVGDAVRPVVGKSRKTEFSPPNALKTTVSTELAERSKTLEIRFLGFLPTFANSSEEA